MADIRFEVIKGEFGFICGNRMHRDSVPHDPFYLCGEVFLEGSVFVEVYADGRSGTLAADKSAVCPKCGDVKESRTPAVFQSPEEALEKIGFLEARIAKGGRNFFIPLVNHEPLGPF